MPRIRQLDPHVVNKIAAGEVIERPASVVKELLENSLDALATRVEVDVAEGGAELIRVVDDGEGMHPDDLSLAVTSHATSKIQSADDLFRVQSMGFRGEALASIASVSRMRLRTRQADQEIGYELEVDFGRPGMLQPAGGPPGTVIEIRQLFANTPVRRKFLKSTAAEFANVSEQFNRIALARPRLHAVLRHNGRTVYEMLPAEQLIDRLRLVYGSELTDRLIWVESELRGVRMWGYVAHPSQSKSTRKNQYLFLNGRWIQDKSLQHALGEAYRGLLMVGRYPITFLYMEMPPDEVDVNVHPTKAEVRFRDSQQLYRQILSTLRNQFLGMNLESTLSVPERPRLTGFKPSVDPEKQHDAQQELAAWAKQQLADWDPSAPPQFFDRKEDIGSGSLLGNPLAPHFPTIGSEIPSRPPGDFGAPQVSPGAESVPIEPGVTRLDGGAHSPAVPHFRPPRVLQVHDCYLVVETDEGLTVIDQHALHERVLYEQLRNRVLAGPVESQRMLVPETVELPAAEAALLVEHRDVLAELGFGIGEFGGGTLLLTGYPAMLAKADPVELVRHIAEQISGAGQKPSRRDILDRLLHMMSCKAAVKAGQRLSHEEMEALIAQRHLVDDAHHCPHGRPTALVLSRAELDRQFGRI
ncbi:MAG: DNA mismatch repair endonuclease MutL [Planctomycetaceae bacterium]